jgi:predicted glycoside hydrolase/deacetylase ChbG (UPF0249 family)
VKITHLLKASAAASLLCLLGCATAEVAHVADARPQRRLIVTADDFGASVNINRGIACAVEHGIVNTVSAMTSFPDSLPALKLLHERHPDVGIGVHLNITTGGPLSDPETVPSLVDRSGNFFTIQRILSRVDEINAAELRRELTAQIEELRRMDIPVDHLSSQHGVLWLYEPFFRIVMDLAAQYEAPVRSPVVASVAYPDIFPDAPTRKRARKIALRFAAAHPLEALRLLKHTTSQHMENMASALDRRGIPHPDLLVDALWGEPTPVNLRRSLENLPRGVSELIVHVGSRHRQETYPTGLDLGYFEARERELGLVTSTGTRELLEELDIRRVGYAALESAQPAW